MIARRDLFWQPDLVLYNSAVQPWDSHVQPTKTWVYPDGFSWDSTPASLTFECEYNFRAFPFDTQNCSMQFASWCSQRESNLRSPGLASLACLSGDWHFVPRCRNHIAAELDLQFANEADDGYPPASINANFNSISWEVRGVTTTRRVLSYPSGDFPELYFHLQIRRYHSWYVYNGILPTVFTTGVAIGSVFIEISDGARTGLCITALLTISTLHIVVTTGQPIAKDVNWYDVLSIGCFIFAFTAMAETLFVSYLVSRKTKVLSSKLARAVKQVAKPKRAVARLVTGRTSVALSNRISRLTARITNGGASSCGREGSAAEHPERAPDASDKLQLRFEPSCAEESSQANGVDFNGGAGPSSLPPRPLPGRLRRASSLLNAVTHIGLQDLARYIDRIVRTLLAVSFVIFITVMGATAGR